MTSQPGIVDSNTRLNDDENEDSLASHRRSSQHLLRRNSTSRSTILSRSAPLLTPSSSTATTTTNSKADLLFVEESGLSGVRVSSEEVHRRYRDAFNTGVKTPEIYQMEKEADEIDFGFGGTSLNELVENEVDTGGRRRRASVSKVILATTTSAGLRSATPSAQPGLTRAIHTSAVDAAPLPLSSSPITATKQSTAFPASFVDDPPQATLPRHRRHSTASILDVPSSSSAPPPAEKDFLLDAVRNHRRSPRSPIRPSTSHPSDNVKPGSRQSQNSSYVPTPSFRVSQFKFVDAEAEERHRALTKGAFSRSIPEVLRAVRNYEAVESSWSTISHNAAIAALLRVLRPMDSLSPILKLYNDLFTTNGLAPNGLSYELILRAFSTRESGVVQNIQLLERRMKKRMLIAKARGPEWGRYTGDDILTPRERKVYADLKGEDYLTPAIQVYTAMGPETATMDPVAVQKLFESAAARGRVDVALSLFARLDGRRVENRQAKSYDTLMTMYSKFDKDSQTILDIMEAFLEARRLGMRERRNDGSSMRFVGAGKHKYSTEPEYQVMDATEATSYLDFKSSGDVRTWDVAFNALFEVGDSAAAVQLLDKLLEAQRAAEEDGSKLPEGYPKKLTPNTFMTLVSGFIKVDDAASARTWFDQGVASYANVSSKHPIFFGLPMSAGIDAAGPNFEKTEFVELTNHIYRSYTAHFEAYHPIDLNYAPSDITTICDFNLAASYWSPDAAVQSVALDAVLEFVASYRAAAEQGLLSAVLEKADVERPFSTGLLARVVGALAHHQRWEEAKEVYLDLTESTKETIIFESSPAMRKLRDQERESQKLIARSARTWALTLVDPTAAMLGLVPNPTRTNIDGVRAFAAQPNWFVARSPPPSIQIVTSVLFEFKLITDADGLHRRCDLEITLISAFLRDYRAAEWNAKALDLSSDQWFTILDSAAQVALYEREGVALPFEFPGFEPIADAFFGTEMLLDTDREYNYVPLVKALKASGISNQRIVALLCTIDPRINALVESGEFSLSSLFESQPFSTSQSSLPSIDLAPAPSAEFEAITATDISSALDSSESVSLPTPPSTPPTYLSSQASSVVPERSQKLDLELSRKLETLILGEVRDVDKAYKVAFDGAAKGRLAHPEALARLVEALGRDHKVDQARRVYLLAYDALPLLELEQQSLAWVLLEDKMIIALAHGGAMEDVTVHRRRLLEQGSAPSADAYAAMILNMYETTDDAAVALELFEESQRHGVAPNVYLFNTLISKLSRARRAREALTYFELMKQTGVRPTSITYGAIINACCKTGDDVSADYLFKEMVRSPLFRPRVPPYNTMIQFYTSTKPSRDRALDYFDQLVRARVQPTGHTYKLLLDAYGLIGEPDLASVQDVFKKLIVDEAVTVTGAHWASLIQTYGERVGDVAKTLEIFDAIATHPSTIQGKSHQPDAVVYESLLNVFVHHNLPDMVEKYVKQMQERGVRMTAYVANTIINVSFFSPVTLKCHCGSSLYVASY